jgi:hypothetical protein
MSGRTPESKRQLDQTTYKEHEMSYTEDELAALSDEERAALEEDTDVAPENEGGEETDNDESNATGADSEEEEAQDSDAEDNEAKDAAETATEPEQKTDAGFVYEPATSAAVDFSKQLEELSDKFEKGEISTKEFAVEMNKISVAQAKAESAAETANEIRAQRWDWSQKEFFKAMPEFGTNADGSPKDPIMFAALDAQLKMLYADPEKRGYSELEYLREAGKLVRTRFNIANPSDNVTPIKDGKRGNALQKAKLPKTLSDTPTAAENDSDEFASLDKMSGLELEAALAQLSPAKQKKYLMMG